MSNPLSADPFAPTVVQPETEGEPDPTEELVGDHSQDEEKDNKRYLVKTPWYIDTLDGGDKFPVVTPKGVEMSADERQAAYEGAREAGITLKSKEV